MERLETDENIEATTQAEEALIGAILIDAADDSGRATINRVALVLKPGDFRGWNPRYPVTPYQPVAARVFSAMCTCKGAPHIVNVNAELVRRNLLRPGDQAWMVHCGAECPSSFHVEDYARAVAYYSRLRGGEGREANVRITGGVDLGM